MCADYFASLLHLKRKVLFSTPMVAYWTVWLVGDVWSSSSILDGVMAASCDNENGHSLFRWVQRW
ncbi:unnamed protein product [Acanthoscelides obtectus]|uniref:Uncharacterized protein n=1 Tax=Acanthoscelides obtectus TaxID=200917 RepID=A0A9P0Q0A2_ACAOB|nr:unnamed protein product [Acanthoscelides obtectus]CAK1687985.1 hypothetical protein AOBTE_LOCUS36498 [Acanthoscelides obtectus]